jgi:hypothetical protein
MITALKAPFPWFGGKSKVASLVWERFGDVQNYVEPFFGSGAVLLNRPTDAGIETVNDLDAADWPVNEADQHARHLWLCSQEEFRENMKVDPEFYDAKIAGWWVWGQCIWIGSGWCSVQRPHLGDAGRGVNRQLPHLGDAGTGGALCLEESDRTLGTREFLFQYMNELAERLRRVRVCCGDWSRVCGPTPTVKMGTTGVFLDPPYADAADRTDALYSSDSLTVANEVRGWAIAQGNDPRIRIALCGYEGEHVMPESWECVEWKARGGYGSQGENQARENSAKERIWFSPHCLNGKQASLFGGAQWQSNS